MIDWYLFSSKIWASRRSLRSRKGSGGHRAIGVTICCIKTMIAGLILSGIMNRNIPVGGLKTVGTDFMYS